MRIILVLEDSPMFYDYVLSTTGLDREEFNDLPVMKRQEIAVSYAKTHKEDAELVGVEF